MNRVAPPSQRHRVLGDENSDGHDPRRASASKPQAVLSEAFMARCSGGRWGVLEVDARSGTQLLLRVTMSATVNFISTVPQRCSVSTWRVLRTAARPRSPSAWRTAVVCPKYVPPKSRSPAPTAADGLAPALVRMGASRSPPVKVCLRPMTARRTAPRAATTSTRWS